MLGLTPCAWLRSSGLRRTLAPAAGQALFGLTREDIPARAGDRLDGER